MVPGGYFEYFQDSKSSDGLLGQVMLCCNPQQTSP
jgi:hypothetical protein